MGHGCPAAQVNIHTHSGTQSHTSDWELPQKKQTMKHQLNWKKKSFKAVFLHLVCDMGDFFSPIKVALITKRLNMHLGVFQRFLSVSVLRNCKKYIYAS